MMAAMRTLILILITLGLSAPGLAQKPDARGAQPVEEVQPRWENEIRGQAGRNAQRNRNGGLQDRAQDSPPADETSVDAERILPFLAYTLGELHYLDFACGGNDQQVWRDQMIQLLAMEAEDNNRRRDRLIENFNDGYRVQQRYRPVCGPQVETERRALAHRGRDLAEMMRSAYFD